MLHAQPSAALGEIAAALLRLSSQLRKRRVARARTSAPRLLRVGSQQALVVTRQSRASHATTRTGLQSEHKSRGWGPILPFPPICPAQQPAVRSLGDDGSEGRRAKRRLSRNTQRRLSAPRYFSQGGKKGSRGGEGASYRRADLGGVCPPRLAACPPPKQSPCTSRARSPARVSAIKRLEKRLPFSGSVTSPALSDVSRRHGNGHAEKPVLRPGCLYACRFQLSSDGRSGVQSAGDAMRDVIQRRDSAHEVCGAKE
ncbi:hypothetical protein HPB50_013155 [Hyalomma asiaticum]|uniref:Uncharacterized protein n=1 Tax=Hyalomma asiaticum TaxID=266040 RepID=A0ACB7SXP7_HYAAI|nr:hypothetical protein HPB50_013155 [Hyalomma asiaticum]